MSRREHFLETLFLGEGSEAIAPDETVLWQGRPQTLGLTRSLFHIRVVMGYFVVLAAWNLASAHADGLWASAALGAAAWVAVPAAVAGLVFLAMSWLIAATTHYTITDRRVIMQIGVALPIALTLPLKRILGAGVKLNADGSGDIPLSLGRQKLAYLLLWPHARPWRLRQPEPMLRAIPDVRGVANILSRALLTASPAGEAIAIAPEPARAPHGEVGVAAA
ncbi:Photosynthetic complex assembly protein [Beijerinckiaceae bacterium RH AL1]|nr:Photosynthetic complex assembly protein [Beijerinckiaceae bacterium RH AL8]VVB43689.1 Photosynthetic complex assembly protein [Beijerinckiaceae bacterium RH CH11]VVC53954.1 Photosynthetic complex assembly protein [Beijerinckiaceae bacterium RH AL1]